MANGSINRQVNININSSVADSGLSPAEISAYGEAYSNYAKGIKAASKAMANATANPLGTGTKLFQNTDTDLALGRFDDCIKRATSSLKQFEGVPVELTKNFKNLGQGVTSMARGFEKYAKMTEEEFQIALKRSTQAENQKFWNAFENQKAAEAQTPKEDKKGVLGKGIKGLAIGAVVGKAIQIALTPVKTIVNVAKSLASTLVKTATSTETFKKIIEMTLMPFTLLFSLIFAPILVKLAPLLADMVQKVTEKWDVLEGIGDRIAEILMIFFDEKNWFSLGSVLDVVIGTLDELSQIAYNTFESCKEAGMTGLDAIVAIAANLIIAFVDKISAFLNSENGRYLFFAVATLVGELLVEGLRLVIMALPDIIISIFTVLGSALLTAVAEVVRNVANAVRGIPLIGTWASDAINGFADFISPNSSSNNNSMINSFGSGGASSSGNLTTSMITNTSYTTINNNAYRSIGNAYSSKQYAMPGM